MALQCGLLQALKMKRANHSHSHGRNRNRNGLGQQAALLHALLQVLYLLMLSTRVPVLDGGGLVFLALKHQRRNQCCLDQHLKARPPNSCTRMLPKMVQFFSSCLQERQFRDPGEHMGPSFFSIPSCWGCSLVGTGTE